MSSFFDRFKKDVGVDLGTANSLIYLKGEGIIINEPTVISVNNKTGKTIAIGNDAKLMLGRNPGHVDVVRPLVNGVVSDFLMTEEILRHFFDKIKSKSIFNYIRAVVAIPTNITEVERKSTEDAVISSGASSVYLIEEPVAAALGSGIHTDTPNASMIVDIGGGTTEIAIISLGGVVVSKSLKIAGDKLNDDIIKFIRNEFKLSIGEQTAERIKIKIGGAVPFKKKENIKVSGIDLSSGLPKEVSIRDVQIRYALMQSLKKMVESIKSTIEQTPPELAGDILHNGIYLSGGGSMLKGLPLLIEKEINVKAILVDEPLNSVVKGAGIAVEKIDKYKNLFVTSKKPIELQ